MCECCLLPSLSLVEEFLCLLVVDWSVVIDFGTRWCIFGGNLGRMTSIYDRTFDQFAIVKQDGFSGPVDWWSVVSCLPWIYWRNVCASCWRLIGGS